jgi:metal-dependent amidase/aminoacylase/carboxypeptidase family protein
VIPDSVEIGGTLRALDEAELSHLVTRIENVSFKAWL